MIGREARCPFRTVTTGRRSAPGGDARAGYELSGSVSEAASNSAVCSEVSAPRHGRPRQAGNFCADGPTARQGRLPLRPGPPHASAERGQEFRARLLAAAAGFGADAAMLVHAGMPFALVRAGPADGLTGFQDGPGDVRVVAGVAGEDVPGRDADVGAVKVGSDALVSCVFVTGFTRRDFQPGYGFALEEFLRM